MPEALGATGAVATGAAAVWALATVPVAAALWWVVFSWQPGNFWVRMGLSTALLGALALGIRGFAVLLGTGLRPSDAALGVASAAVLYGVFYLGRLMVPSSQVGSVYRIRAEAPSVLIAALLLLVIGPGEELYWRGLVQAGLAHWLPLWAAVVLAAAIYAATHLFARNPTLVLAAFVGGLFWGGLYAVTGRLAPVVISHALWDLAVLLLLPLGRQEA